MGETVRVSDDGLHDLADRCDEAARALADGGVSVAAGPSFQATTAAIRDGQALVRAAAGVFAARASVTGSKLRAAAAVYTRTDAASSDQLAAVSQTIRI
jgi:hypothetical protein